MGRPKSVILTPQELKAALGTNNAQLKDLKARLKVYEGDLASATKAYDKAKAPLERKLLESVLAAPVAAPTAPRPSRNFVALLAVAEKKLLRWQIVT